MNPELFVIRPATVDDVQTIIDFNTAMAQETEQRQLEPARLREGVRTVLGTSEHGFYVLAEHQQSGYGHVVGQLMITFEWSDWRNGVFWWVQSVYVMPEWRRHGVYRAMHDHIIAKARTDQKVCGIRLYVEQQNHSAQSVYHRVGLRPSGYQVFEQDFVLQSQRQVT
ncbi:MAG TPA: GNAT family N-acetyltransferase [Nitrospira sp.]|nr:GNAT family N-acetyltransferase [Nitrospira sp.]